MISPYRNSVFGDQSNVFESKSCPGYGGRIVFEDKLKTCSNVWKFCQQMYVHVPRHLVHWVCKPTPSTHLFYCSQCLEGRLSCQDTEELPSVEPQFGCYQQWAMEGWGFPQSPHPHSDALTEFTDNHAADANQLMAGESLPISAITHSTSAEW